jgi:hypothetical protein
MFRASAIVSFASGAVLIGAIGACGSGRGDADSATGMERIWYEELSVLAEARLECPRERLEYEYLGDKVHLLEGCGKQIRYMIFQRGDLWVKIESFHERAAFELQCDVRRLVSIREDETSWRVTGCDRQIWFSLDCADDGVICEWVSPPWSRSR